MFAPVIVLMMGACLLSCSSSKRPALTPNTSTTSESPAPERPPLEAGPTSPQSNKAFVDKTADYGLDGVRGVRFYAVDLNNNSYSDLVILPDFYSVPEFYYFNPEKMKFIKDDVTRIPDGLRASFLAFYDFDNDGVLDVIVGTLNQSRSFRPIPLKFFKGQLEEDRLVFEHKERAIPKHTEPVASVLVLDYDLDGKLDFFQGNWFDMTQDRRPPIPDRLYRGSGLRFHEDSARLQGERDFDRALNTFTNATPTFSASFCDLDGNGYPDILTASAGGHENKMWLNLAAQSFSGRMFRNYAEESGYAEDDIGSMNPLGGGYTNFSICTDYNNNGIIDILVGELTHPYDPESRDRSSFLTGATLDFPPRFIRTEYHYDEVGPKTQADQRGVFVDLNRDGLIDVLVDNSGFPPDSRLIAFVQNEDHSFEDQAINLGIDIVNPVGTIVLDVNRDGRMDILTGQVATRDSRIQPRLYLFENQLPYNDKRSLRVFLRGEKSNRQGIGATLKLSHGQVVQTRFATFQDGPQPSQNEEGVFFGLGQNSTLSSLKVIWPYYEVGGEGESGKVLEMSYDLSKLKFERHLDITVCESGSVLKGRRPSCD